MRHSYVWENKITDVDGGMWEGLDSLELLHLADNNITSLDAGDLSHLPSIKELWLQRTLITALSVELCDADLYPATNGHPAEMQINFGRVPVQCDSRLCWMEEAEKEGWLTLNKLQFNNYQNNDWKDVNLDWPVSHTQKNE